MRPLGITMKGVNGSAGLVNNTRSNSTMVELVYQWNVWETQIMVFLSFMLQLFLFGTGSLRRHNPNGVLKALIWLAYLGADSVAIYATGLFSQYEDRYKRGRESFGDTLPFLWVPFLLVHLGGQDSITAFSLEDNNLWHRHLLKLVTQGVLGLYAFWKSFYRINSGILFPAMLVFVSGIIKYGERIWALKSASRNGLGTLSESDGNEESDSNEYYALQIVHLARGLFVGRTLRQLGNNSKKTLEKFVGTFFRRYEEEDRLKIAVMEHGMMSDLLYSKVNVLRRRTGVLLRSISMIVMGVAFLLFLLRSVKGAHTHNRVNFAITCTLFSGTMFMEICSIAVVVASTWARAYFKRGSFLYGLSNSAASLFKAVQFKCNKRHRSSISSSMWLFNFMDYAMDMKYKPTILSKAICAIGLDKQWRNLWYVHRVDDAGRAGERIISGVMEILHTAVNGRVFRPLHLSGELSGLMCLCFEDVLYRLHIYTDWCINRHSADTNTNTNTNDVTIMQLKEECETLSNYMMYLMVVYPSMLPVSTAAEDFEPALLKWVTSKYGDGGGARTKLEILEDYTEEIGKSIFHAGRTRSDEDLQLRLRLPEQRRGSFHHLEQRLEKIKKIWLRLLIYAAGKCSGEIARQLGEGGELITFVWLLMAHHDLGDVSGEELSLLGPNEPYVFKLPEYIQRLKVHTNTGDWYCPPAGAILRAGQPGYM